jgi:R67 dihydrofolate reductase
MTFNRGDYVRKKSGAFWEGDVVGDYSTDQTADGVAVRLFGWPDGPVQIYPAAALEHCDRNNSRVPPPPSSHLAGALRAAEEEFNRISCEGVTETRSVSDALDRARAFADRGAAACRSALAPSPSTHLRGYQERVAAAHHALFHDDPTDVAERVARFFEEAVETCQALGLTHYDADKLLNYTYDRPVGEPKKEIGAALLTLASLCVVAGYDLAECGEADLEKLQRPETIARIRAKRSTRHGRGPLPGLDPALATTEGKDNA